MAKERKGFFGRLVEGLTKTRNSIVSGIDPILTMNFMKRLKRF